jgi:hypothetical protein
MRSRLKLVVACGLTFILMAQAARAQTAAPPPQATEDALHAMTRMAAVIFAGKVTAVRPRAGVNGATGVIEVEFAIDDAIRGVAAGTYTLREWAGLAPAGNQPFRVGQRYLMLLHAAGPAGLSSPVGGTDGAIPIRGSSPPLDPEAYAIAPQLIGRVVDLRWVATRVVNPAAYPTEPTMHLVARPILAHAEVATEPAQNSASQPIPQAEAASVAPESPPASQSGGYATILSMLRSWEKTDHAAR